MLQQLHANVCVRWTCIYIWMDRCLFLLLASASRRVV